MLSFDKRVYDFEASSKMIAADMKYTSSSNLKNPSG
jgi:hypothetical protein